MDGDRLRSASAAAPGPPSLSAREREVLTLLAEGLSGAEIAERLVLSPETVRTHVRNALAKLGASTRSQGVAIALHRGEIAASPSRAAAPPPAEETPSTAAPTAQAPPQGRVASHAEIAEELASLLEDLTSLLDMDGGAIFLVDEDGFTLRRVAAVSAGIGEQPVEIALGDGVIGRVALERRAQVGTVDGSGDCLITAPMLDSGRLVGTIVLATRPSRPAGRRELLLLQVFANRVGEVIAGGSRIGLRLRRARESFRRSWTSTTRPA